jgi:hypothetical protein
VAFAAWSYLYELFERDLCGFLLFEESFVAAAAHLSGDLRSFAGYDAAPVSVVLVAFASVSSL